MTRHQNAPRGPADGVRSRREDQIAPRGHDGDTGSDDSSVDQALNEESSDSDYEETPKERFISLPDSELSIEILFATKEVKGTECRLLCINGNNGA
jgi:hypothetical protein